MDNPWLKILMVFIGVPVALLLFVYGAILSMGGGGDVISFILYFVVIFFVAYKAISYHRKQKKLQSSKD